MDFCFPTSILGSDADISLTTKTKLRLDGETDELPRVLKDHFSWIVAGKEVGAYWHRYETQCDTQNDNHSDRQTSVPLHLGGPLPVNAQDCPLRLWIGVSERDHELLIFLTLLVRLNKRVNKARRMFLLVPAESLTLGTTSMFEALTVDQVPECLFERPSDSHSVQSNYNGFLHINLALDSSRKSKVIMPSRTHEGSVCGTALSLLDCFKSLSESSSFDVYLKFDTYAQKKLRDLTSNMTDDHCRLTSYTTPVFDVKGMYSRGRDGAFDLWQAQGWQPSDKAVPQSRKRKASDQPESPPQYSPHLPAIHLPTYDDCSAGPLASRSQLTVAHETPIPPHEPLQMSVPRSCTPVNRMKRRMSQGSVVSRVCDTPLTNAGETAAVLNDVSVAAPTTAHITVTPAAAPDAAHPAPGLFDPASAAALSVTAPVTAPPNVAPTIASAASPSAVLPGIAPLVVALDDHVPITIAPLVDGNAIVLPSTRFFNEMSDWLVSAWQICPLAHYRCIVHLLALGCSAKLERVELYDNLRVKCTERLISLMARASAPVDLTNMSISSALLTHETHNLVSWMLTVNSRADTEMFELLIGFERESKAVMELIDTAPSDEQATHTDAQSDESNRRYTQFLHSKAHVVLQVCFRYGTYILGSKTKATVAQKMFKKAKELAKK